MSIVLLPLLLLTLFSTYYRFIALSDYLVSYEGECDPESQTCYVDCEDEECTSEYYFTLIERQHNEIYALCGEDITGCESASYCKENEVDCSVTYCDLETEAEFCETINETNI